MTLFRSDLSLPTASKPLIRLSRCHYLQSWYTPSASKRISGFLKCVKREDVDVVAVQAPRLYPIFHTFQPRSSPAAATGDLPHPLRPVRALPQLRAPRRRNASVATLHTTHTHRGRRVPPRVKPPYPQTTIAHGALLKRLASSSPCYLRQSAAGR